MSGYIGTQPVPQATQHRETFTATAGQTSFATAGYTPQFLDVFLNGIHLLNPDDYTASNGSDVVLTTGAALDDVLEVISYSPFEVANQTFTGTTSTDNLSVTGAFTSKGIDDNATSTAMTLDASGNLLVGKTTPSLSTAGTAIRGDNAGLINSARNGVTLELNRLSTDGNIAEFYKDGADVGSIGTFNTGGTGLTVGASGVGLYFRQSADSILPWSMTTNYYKDNALDLGDAGDRFKDLYLSGGVYLGGTGAANYLQDYEIGTWTPSYGGATGITYTGQSGTYVKVGDLVTLWWRIDYTGTMGGTNIRITGRPFYQYTHETTMNIGTLGVRTSLNVGGNDVFFPAMYGTADAIYIYNTSFGALNYTSVWKAGSLSGTLTYRAN